VQSPPSPVGQKQAMTFSSSSQKQALHQSKPELAEDSLVTAAFTPYAKVRPITGLFQIDHD